MTGLVINKGSESFNQSWESFALRTSLCLLERTCCIGPSTYAIMYQDWMSKMPLHARLQLLTDNEKDPTFKKRLEDTAVTIKLLRKRKHRTKREIVDLKFFEKHINKLYDDYLDHMVKHLKKFGLIQLEPFYTGEEKILNLWDVNKDHGEKDKEGRLSRILAFELEDSEDETPDIFVFYEKMAHELLESHTLTPLATLPNLNGLDIQKLRLVRKRFGSLREELKPLLPPLLNADGKQEYYAGEWNVEGVKAIAPKLQKAIDDSPELQLAKKLYKDFDCQLHVGNMDTPQLWQLLYDNELMPKDTYEVLQKKLKSGKHCPTTAIMTVTSSSPTVQQEILSEEETLPQKRKTISLD